MVLMHWVWSKFGTLNCPVISNKPSFYSEFSIYFMSAEKEKVDTKLLVGTTLSQAVKNIFSFLKSEDSSLPLLSYWELGLLYFMQKESCKEFGRHCKFLL